MGRKYRVIQWATGKVGKQALKGIIDHPQLELAGLWVHNPDDAGIDAGEFCGYPKTGIVASADAEEVLAIAADCVAYFATSLRRRQLADLVKDIASMLRSGKNVVGVQESSDLPDSCSAGSWSTSSKRPAARGVLRTSRPALMPTAARRCSPRWPACVSGSSRPICAKCTTSSPTRIRRSSARSATDSVPNGPSRSTCGRCSISIRPRASSHRSLVRG